MGVEEGVKRILLLGSGWLQIGHRGKLGSEQVIIQVLCPVPAVVSDSGGKMIFFCLGGGGGGGF